MVRKSVLLLIVCLGTFAHAQRRSLAASPTSLDMGSVTLGDATQQSVTLTSNGLSNVKISAIASNSAEFVVTAPSLPITLAPGSKMSFTVRFSPATAGNKSASVTVSATAANSPVISVKGVAVSPAPVAPPSTTETAYGNVGDAYEGSTPGSAVSISACQILMPNTSYRLSNNVSALTATDICFQLTGANTTLDLNGYKVTGRIVGGAVNINGTHIFHGSVECNRDASLGGNVGCIYLYGDYYAPAAQVRVHHLNIFNSAACGRSLQLNWDTTTPWTGGQYLARFYNITSATASGPACSRSYNFGVTASDVTTVEVHNNDLTCAADSAACQGVMFWNNDRSRVHHNRFNMQQNITAESGRAVICDGHADSCEVDHNLVIANNNRAFRVRDSAHARIHDNVVERIASGGTAVHLADPDTGSNDLDAIVENNTFEVADGMVLMIRAGFNAWFRNNTLTCAGCSATSSLARVRTAGTTNIVFENNPTATALGTPQIYVESGTSATVCNSGQAGGTGTITNSTSCTR